MFLKNGDQVAVNEQTFSLQEFQALEPDYECEYLLESYGPDGHWVSNGPGTERVDGSTLYPSRQSYLDKTYILPREKDWLQLIQDVNLGPILMPWMLQNANPNSFSYLLAVVNNTHRQPWMLYTALGLVFPGAPDEIKTELNQVLLDNNFKEIAF
jgi:hypothetical protein